MTSGYKLFWTKYALSSLENVLKYLQTEWGEKEQREFIHLLEKSINIIVQTPFAGKPSSENLKRRKLVISKQISIYYFIVNRTVSITHVFDNRQNPLKAK